MSFTVQATASYMRVRVTNLSTTTATTYFRLQTALCPIVEAVPRALDEDGNFKTSVEQIHGDMDTTVEVTPMNALRTADATRLIGASFGSGTTIETNSWTSGTPTGSATAALLNGIVTLSTGITTGSSITFSSTRTARYVGGTSLNYRGVIRLPAVTGANTRRWGAFSATNGFYFEHDGTTLSVGHRIASSDTTKASGLFNGVLGATYLVDTNVHTYEIHWTHRNAWFFVDCCLLHTFTATTTPLSAEFSLPGATQITNGANINNNTIEAWVLAINRLGSLLTQPTSQRITLAAPTTTVLKRSAGNIHSIVIGTAPTAAGTITIYDGTDATGSVISLLTVKTPNTQNIPVHLDFKGAPFFNGLTIVTATNAIDFTVIYE